MFFIKNFVDNAINQHLDIDTICNNFETQLASLSEEDLSKLLLFSGYIPDIYKSDSSEETLYSKLVEVLICIWARKINLTSTYIKQKASYEDINIQICNQTVVCDAKSFRLGRSQKAPNVKDFLKLADIEKWLNRHPNKLGGLVVYPDTHEWTSGSDAYQYCTTKKIPTVMLPYKYLSLILHYKNNLSSENILKLWEYNILFPTPLLKQNKNKEQYWNKINTRLQNILQINNVSFEQYLKHCDILIRSFIKTNKYILTQIKEKRIQEITHDINQLNHKELKKLYMKYRINTETKQINELIDRINKFRLK